MAIEYRGESFPGYNKPKKYTGSGRFKKRVLAKKGDKVKIINFGHKSYKHNYSKKARDNYLKRSAGIKNKSGQNTSSDKHSANYWSRKELWNA